MSLALPAVTVCAADCVNPRAALRALAQSAQACRFGEVILFTDAPGRAQVTTRGAAVEEPDGAVMTGVPAMADLRIVTIPTLASRDAYSTFMLRDLHAHIRTPWVLVVQWDGYVVCPGAWQDAFLQYDYVGAPWPWHRDGHDVGNGGFSLRSRRLLDLLATGDFRPVAGLNEDDVICRLYRSRLEQHGMRFAPAHVAAQFSFERAQPEAPTFGFHGAFNLWRYLDPPRLVRLVEQLRPSPRISDEMAQLLWAVYDLRRFDCMLALYRHFGGHHDSAPRDLNERLIAAGMPHEAAQRCIGLCTHLERQAQTFWPDGLAPPDAAMGAPVPAGAPASLFLSSSCPGSARADFHDPN